MAADYFETVILLNPDDNEKLAKTIYDTTTMIKSKGVIIEHEDIGDKTTAYPIKSHDRAYYQVYKYKTESDSLITLLEKSLRLNDTVLKYITLRLNEEEILELNEEEILELNEANTSEQKHPTLAVQDMFDLVFNIN